jgi:hypothetical protein
MTIAVKRTAAQAAPASTLFRVSLPSVAPFAATFSPRAGYIL